MYFKPEMEVIKLSLSENILTGSPVIDPEDNGSTTVNEGEGGEGDF